MKMPVNLLDSINDLDTDQFNTLRNNLLREFNIQVQNDKIINPHPIFGCFWRSDIIKGLQVITHSVQTLETNLSPKS